MNRSNRWSAPAGLVLGAALLSVALPPPARSAPPDGDPTAYGRDMHAAFTFAREGDPIRARDLLDRWHAVEPDSRGWEWYHVRALCREPWFLVRVPRSSVQALAWSADGKRLASGTNAGGVAIWDVTTQREGARLASEFQKPVFGLAWSRNGNRLAALAGASEPLALKVWDTTTGKQVFAADGLRGAASSNVLMPILEWSPDDGRLAVVTRNETVIYEVSTGKTVHTLSGAQHGVIGAVWSPNGEQLATASSEHVATVNSIGIKLWDAKTGKESRALTGSSGLSSVVWSPDGKRVAASGPSQTIRVWEAGTGKVVFSPEQPPGAPPAAGRLDWAEDGKTITAAGRTTFKSWDVTTWAELQSLSVQTGTYLSLNGRHSLRFEFPSGVGQPGQVLLVDTATGSLIQRLRGFPRQEGAAPSALAWSPDGKYVAAGGRGGTLHVWSLTGPARRQLPLPCTGVSAWSPDGRQLFFMDDSLAVTSFDAVTGGQRVLLEGITQTRVSTAEWSPDGRRVAALIDGVVRVWSVVQAEQPLTLKGEAKEVTSLVWSGDGRRLAAAARDGKVTVWDTAGGDLLSTVGAKEQLPVTNGPRLFWAPDHRRLAVVRNPFPGPVRIWDSTTGKESLTPETTFTTPVHALVWSPDGKWLAAMATGNALKIWDSEMGRELFDARPGSGGAALALSASPDSTRLAYFAEGPVLKILEISTKKELAALRPVGIPRALAWSPDGRRLAIESVDLERFKLTQEVFKQLQQAKVPEPVLEKIGPLKNKLLTYEEFQTEIAKVLDAEEAKRFFDHISKLARDFSKQIKERTVKIIDVSTVKPVTSLSAPSETLGECERLIWSPDGEQVGCVSPRGEVEVWEVKTGKLALSQSGAPVPGPGVEPSFHSPGAFAGVFWDASEPRLHSIRLDPGTQNWGMTAGKEARTIGGVWGGKWGESAPAPAGASPAAGPPVAVAWSGDRGLLALNLGSTVIDARRVPSGERVWSLKGQSGLTSLAWRPDNKQLAAIRSDGSIEVWELATGKSILSIKGGKVPARPAGPSLPRSWGAPLAWSPDGKWLAAYGEGRTAVIWNAVTGAEQTKLSGHGDDVLAIAWSPDGKRIVTASTDRALKVWEAATGKNVLTLKGHTGAVHSVVWSPNGQRLASVGQQESPGEGPGALKLWEATTGQELANWSNQLGPVAWSPDGRRLISLTRAALPHVAQLTVWDAPPADEKPRDPAPKDPAKSADK